MKSVLQAPGLYYEAMAPPAEPSPLRSDIAGFVGRTRRGPTGKPVRVTGWREYLILFGGLTAKADTPFALRGYFENGGDVAYVVRLLGRQGPFPVTALRTRCGLCKARPLPKHRGSAGCRSKADLPRQRIAFARRAPAPGPTACASSRISPARRVRPGRDRSRGPRRR